MGSNKFIPNKNSMNDEPSASNDPEKENIKTPINGGEPSTSNGTHTGDNQMETTSNIAEYSITNDSTTIAGGDKVPKVVKKPKKTISKNYPFTSTSSNPRVTQWSPVDTPVQLSMQAINRIKKDIGDIKRDPMDDVWIQPDEQNLSNCDVVIKGPKTTPYEGGYFWFRVQFTSEYPFKPPRVKFLTTGNGSVRFNPNLYADGKVCLSKLGTWAGPSWTSIMSLKSLVITLRSILSENPIQNEPGYENLKPDTPAAQSYIKYVTFCTLKYGVLNHIKAKADN